MMLCRKIEFFHALISTVLCFNVFRIALGKMVPWKNKTHGVSLSLPSAIPQKNWLQR
jgi:hypothetical protein